MPYQYTPSVTRRWTLRLSAGIGDGHTAGQVRHLVSHAVNDGTRVVELQFVQGTPLDVTRVRSMLVTWQRQAHESGWTLVLRDAPAALRSWALAGLFQFAESDAAEWDAQFAASADALARLADEATKTTEAA
jgi:hypothetical protein